MACSGSCSLQGRELGGQTQGEIQAVKDLIVSPKIPMFESYPIAPWNVPLFGNKVVADVIS